MKFVPRTECPQPGNKWYTRKGYGGESPCIAGKPEKWRGSVLSNCVGYTFGRVAEVLGKFIKIGYTYGGKPYSAQNWFDAKDGLPRGKTPKIGAVACWKKNDGKSGHVCNCEEVYDDLSWQSSESAYNGSAWKTRKYPKTSYRKGFTFQGFIYIPLELDPEPDKSTLKVGDTVKIVGPGYSSAKGGTVTLKPEGWTRRILSVKPGNKCPYRVGYNGITTAWYPAESLQKK